MFLLFADIEGIAWGAGAMAVVGIIGGLAKILMDRFKQKHDQSLEIDKQKLLKDQQEHQQKREETQLALDAYKSLIETLNKTNDSLKVIISKWKRNY